MNRLKILITIPEDFRERFMNFVSNINAVNSDARFEGLPVQIEEVYNNGPPEIAAIPKHEEKKGDTVEDQNM